MHLQNKLLFLMAANFAFTFVNSEDVDYCNVPSCKQRKHVMCEFRKPGGDAECGVGHEPQLMTESMKTELLDWHNTLRSGVALSTSKLVPGGGFDRPVSNMIEMKWSKELEQFAQRWADQCDVAVQREHDECRNTMLSDQRKEAGQLVYTYTYSAESGAVDLAMEELKKEWTQGPLVMPEGEEKIAGPQEWILQVTWPSANTLGCAMSHFAKGEQGVLMIVCNYGAAIGPVGGPRYGESCTNCPPPNKCSNVRPGLCIQDDTSAADRRTPALLALVTGLALAFYLVDNLDRGRRE